MGNSLCVFKITNLFQVLANELFLCPFMKLWRKIILKKPLMHCLQCMLTVFFILVLTMPVAAQRSLRSDSLKISRDSLVSHLDSSNIKKPDSVSVSKLEDSLGIMISKDALSSIVKAEATDSA